MKLFGRDLSQAKHLKKTLLVIILFVIAGVLITGLGIYTLGWQNGWARAVSRVVPFPAISVNGSLISYYEYQTEAAKTKQAVEQAAATLPEEAGFDGSQAVVNQSAAASLVNRRLIMAWAETQNITVTEAELGTAYQQLLKEYGGEDTARQQLQEQGSNLAQLKADLRAQLFQSKVAMAVAQLEANQQQAKARAETVLGELKAGADFQETVERYSQHYSAHQPDRGQVFATTLPLAVTDELSNLKDGELLDKVVQEGDDYYLLKREQTTADDIIVRIIQIRPQNYTEWLAQEVQEARITYFLPQIRN